MDRWTDIDIQADINGWHICKDLEKFLIFYTESNAIHTLGGRDKCDGHK